MITFPRLCVQLIDDRESLGTAIFDREHDVEQHTVVLKNLEKQEGSRRAWKLVSDVLVERTVAEMIVDVTKNRDNLIAIVQNLRKQLETHEKDVIAYQDKYKIRLKGEGNGNGKGGGASAAAAAASGQGVLVR